MTTATGRLAGKKALVTGGSRGIGAAVVRRLVNEGATVVVNYRASADAAEALMKELDGEGGGWRPRPMSSSMLNFIAIIVRRCGAMSLKPC